MDSSAANGGLHFGRVLTSTFTREDVCSILTDFSSVLRTDLAKELEHSSHTVALVLQQVFTQLEGKELFCSIETSNLEDQMMLKVLFSSTCE